jgi:putative ABC transport system permease protein
MFEALRAALRAIDSEQVTINERAMTDGVALSLAARRFSLAVVGCFAVMGLLLSAVGINGLAAFVVAERTREIGVHRALGAQGRDIVQTLLGPVVRAATLGVVLGVPAAVAIARLLAGTLFGVGPADPATLIGVCGLISTVAVAAVYLPARRMLRVDPVIALRHE